MDRMTKAAAIGVGVLALIATTLLTAAVIPDPAPRASAGNTYDNIAAEYGVTIDWFTQAEAVCDEGASGCIDYDSLDSINVMSGQTNYWTLYVVLHEIGHVIQYREGGAEALNECDADAWALEHGALTAGYYC